MKEFRFSGYSDDTFGEFKATGDDYDNCASGEPIDYLLVNDDGVGVVISGQYGRTGAVWSVGVAPYDPICEGREMPNWPIVFDSYKRGDGSSHSPVLVVAVPDDVRVTLRCITREEAKAGE